MAPLDQLDEHGIVQTWWMFAGVGLLLVAYGIYAFLLPTLDQSHWIRNGIVRTDEASEYVGHTFRWLGILATMVGFLTLVVAYMGYRVGHRAAWYGFLGYPVFFVFAIAFTWPGWLWSPLLVASLISLWDFHRATSRSDRG